MADAGTQFGKYRVIEKLAEGGSGSVYRAQHPTLPKQVIIKQLKHVDSAPLVERFRREAQIMIEFRHENIVQVYDHFQEGSSFFIVMECVDGISLSDLIKERGRLPNEAVMLIATEVCKALSYAHGKGVVHRDIKPGNILISKAGEVKLTDFGIATSKLHTEDGLTSAGMTLGTPAYMSPEQLTDVKNVDQRADIYSLGVTMYEMACAVRPFPAEFNPETVALIQKGQYKAPRRINPELSSVLNRLIRRAMHRNRNKRFRDLAQMQQVLQRSLARFRNQEAINTAIQRYVAGEARGSEDTRDLKDSRKRPTPGGRRFRPLYVILLLILLAGGYLMWREGLFHEVFAADRMGALRVEVQIPRRSLSRRPAAVLVDVDLGRVQGDTIVPVPGRTLAFSTDASATAGDYVVFRTERVFLPSAVYVLNLDVEQARVGRRFFLAPRVVQRKRRMTRDGRLLRIKLASGEPLPLRFSYSVRDINSGEDISSDTDVYVYAYGWRKWDAYRKSKNFEKQFTTDRTHSFLFRRRGYLQTKETVKVPPFRTDLRLDVAMVPIPGTLVLNANRKGMQVLLDSVPYYYQGGQDRRYLPIPPTSLDEQRYKLAPGDYFLTVRRSDELVKSEKITIRPGRRSQVNVTCDEAAKTMEMKVSP